MIPTGWGFSDTAAGSTKVQKYGVNILLPSNVGFSSVEVSCNNMKVDVLIGMDIISRGDFCITNKKGSTVFTFQTPSTHIIDFYEEIEKYKKCISAWQNKGIIDVHVAVENLGENVMGHNSYLDVSE